MNEYACNIDRLMKSTDGSDWFSGITWYRAAHKVAWEHALRLGHVSLVKSAFALAALSPQASWSRNLAAMDMIVSHLAAGKTSDTFTGKTMVLGASVKKAFRILEEGDLTALNGPKVTAFADNILYPDSSQRVTIDSWAARIALGLIGVTKTMPWGITLKRYEEIAAAYTEVAGWWGLLPLELQAITWTAAHRLEGAL